MKAMKIYISLPISGYPIDDAEARAVFAAGVIEGKGHVPVNPLRVLSEDDSYEAHMGADITALLRSDGIVMLRGWESSRGCALELSAAKIYGKRVYRNLGEIPSEERP